MGDATKQHTHTYTRTHTPIVQTQSHKTQQDALAGGRPGVGVAAGESEQKGDFSPACLLDKAGPEDLVLDLSDTATWEHGKKASSVVGPGEKGLYVLLYCGCPLDGHGEAAGGGDGGGQGGGEHTVSFKLRVAFWNEGVEGDRDYLSAGSESLPKLFLGTFALFFGALVVWAHCIRRNPAQASAFSFFLGCVLCCRRFVCRMRLGFCPAVCASAVGGVTGRSFAECMCFYWPEYYGSSRCAERTSPDRDMVSMACPKTHSKKVRHRFTSKLRCLQDRRCRCCFLRCPHHRVLNPVPLTGDTTARDGLTVGVRVV